MKTILATALMGLALLSTPAVANSGYHDEFSVTHVGRDTVPAMGSKASEPVRADHHDETTIQHVGQQTVPAMGVKNSPRAVVDQHDENTTTHIPAR